MTLSSDDLRRARELCDAATPGPWKHDLDAFDGEICACVTDADISLLVPIDTDIQLVFVKDGERWTDAHMRESDERWRRAKDTQAMRDAAFIAAARTLVPALIDEVEFLRANRDVLIRRGDDYLASINRMRPVIAAAERWHDFGPKLVDFSDAPQLAEERRVLNQAMHDAVDAYRKERGDASGVPIEGDYVCPSDLERDALRAALTEALDGWRSLSHQYQRGRDEDRIAELRKLL